MAISLSFLVIDDSSIMTRMLSNTLKSLGHKVVGECQDPYEAIQMYKKLQPDVVTMDINMPGQNGIDVLKKLTEEFENSVVIMVTAEGIKTSIVQSLNNGAKGYLLKPISPDKLKDTINKLIEKYFSHMVENGEATQESTDQESDTQDGQSTEENSNGNNVHEDEATPKEPKVQNESADLNAQIDESIEEDD